MAFPSWLKDLSFHEVIKSLIKTTSGDESAVSVVNAGGELNTYHSAETTNTDSANFSVSANPSWQAFLTGTSGALAATVSIYATNDNSHWTLVGTMTLTVAAWSSASDDDVAELIPDKFNSWKNTKATISGISGTGAAVTVIGG